MDVQALQNSFSPATNRPAKVPARDDGDFASFVRDAGRDRDPAEGARPRDEQSARDDDPARAKGRADRAATRPRAERSASDRRAEGLSGADMAEPEDAAPRNADSARTEPADADRTGASPDATSAKNGRPEDEGPTDEFAARTEADRAATTPEPPQVLPLAALPVSAGGPDKTQAGAAASPGSGTSPADLAAKAAGGDVLPGTGPQADAPRRDGAKTPQSAGAVTNFPSSPSSATTPGAIAEAAAGERASVQIAAQDGLRKATDGALDASRAEARVAGENALAAQQQDDAAKGDPHNGKGQGDARTKGAAETKTTAPRADGAAAGTQGDFATALKAAASDGGQQPAPQTAPAANASAPARADTAAPAPQPRWAAAPHAQAPANQVGQHIAAQFAAQAQGTGRQAYDIQLDPVELGRVRVRLEVGKDGQVSAAFTADRPETLALLRGDARLLTQALNDAGLSANTASLDFSLGGQRRDGPGDWQGFGGQAGSQGDGRSGGGGDGGRDAPRSLADAPRQRLTGSNTSLDIEV